MGQYTQALIGDPNATLDDIARHYAAKFAEADALEESYRANGGPVRSLFKAAYIRARSLTELSFLGVDAAAVGEGGLRALRSGLRATDVT